jgi:hypothetical protein
MENQDTDHLVAGASSEGLKPVAPLVRFPAMWPHGALLTAEERVTRGMPAEFQQPLVGQSVTNG